MAVVKDRSLSIIRWFRSLQAQLFLWAVLPVTFALLALAFTGVYAHQRAMRDFVAERDLALARLIARLVEDGLAHGTIDPSGVGLPLWLPSLISGWPQETTLIIVDASGRTLVHPDPAQIGADLTHGPGVSDALAGNEGFLIAQTEVEGQVLVAFTPVHAVGWVVLVQEPVAGIIGPILRLSSLAPVIAVGAGLLSLLVLTFGWHTIVRPLRTLSRAAEQVFWGDHSAITQPVSGVQEIRDLHQALAEMVGRIQGYEAGMRDYLGAVTQGQEAERARLARELHDGPVQELIALSQMAEMAQRLIERGEGEQARALLEKMRQAELETIDAVRRLIGALRPAYLEDLGFVPALEALVQQADRQSEAQIRLICEGGYRLAPEIELAVYRVVQEALHNALQHAHAQHIVVQVRYGEDGVTLTVTDDGVGFILPPRPDLLTREGHFGLMGMQERISRLGGSLRIETAPGQGTRLTARFPGHPSSA